MLASLIEDDTSQIMSDNCGFELIRKNLLEHSTSPGCILILGAPNDKQGNLSLIAKSRLLQGKEELLRNPDFKILLTGGFGSHFNETNYPHWKYAKDFLITELAVSPGAFLPEAIESSNTVEDLEKTKLLFQRYNFKKILLVTSGFHMPRAQYIAEKVFDNIQGMLSFSPASDKGLVEELLHKLYAHEKQAIEYLKINYT